MVSNHGQVIILSRPQVVPERLSQVSSQSEVGFIKQCTSNTQPSSGTSAFTFVWPNCFKVSSNNAMKKKRLNVSEAAQMPGALTCMARVGIEPPQLAD